VVDAFLRLVDKGELRAPDDDGGGSTENIENIRNKPADEAPVNAEKA
jgi:energy-coupling factor transport system substrate-specific component